jgi:hypothetical protein
VKGQKTKLSVVVRYHLILAGGSILPHQPPNSHLHRAIAQCFKRRCFNPAAEDTATHQPSVYKKGVGRPTLVRSRYNYRNYTIITEFVLQSKLKHQRSRILRQAVNLWLGVFHSAEIELVRLVRELGYAPDVDFRNRPNLETHLQALEESFDVRRLA